MELKNIKAYRITHINNIPNILKYGITKKHSSTKNVHYKNIGDFSIIEYRKTKKVVVDNGLKTNKKKAVSITLGDYIPFYFGVKMPMLYVIQHGGNFVERPTIPENIIYMACSITELIAISNNFYFTDGHAMDKFTTFYDKSKIEDLQKLLTGKLLKLNIGEEMKI